MILLIAFAFIAGIVTILSPCILPLLPIILSSTGNTGKRRPVGIVVGFVASFTFFTLFLSTLVHLSGIPSDALRLFSILLLAVFGASLIIPRFQASLEMLASKLTGFAPQTSNQMGFFGGIIIGLSLGLLWTPCVGPILASVISLAVSGSVTLQTFLITLAYSLGTAIPMFVILVAGGTVLKKVPMLVRNTAQIQKSFGVIMIITAVALFLNADRKFQTFIINTFPNYGTGLTKIEDNPVINHALETVRQLPMGKNQAPELIQGGQWFNSEPLQLSKLRGKVVLLDFWTYSCINCERTLPYLKSWWAKYKDKGLVIIGVHSPEFEFEKDATNVKKALTDFGITYPVMQDNNFATWKAYDNNYWPAKYLIDKNGVIRDTHFGEGGYDDTEKQIQDLLKETGAQVDGVTIANPTYQVDTHTPETYLGYARMEFLSSPESVKQNQPQRYSAPNSIPDDTFAMSGEWTVMPEFASPSKGAQLYQSFDAKDVYLVIKPTKGTGIINVYLDNKQVNTITVDSDKLYQLINLPKAGRHQLRLDFQDGNLDVYAFTFG